MDRTSAFKPIAITGLLLVAAGSLVACAGAASTGGPTGPSTTGSPTDAGPGTGGPASALTITRSGGIAGVNDRVEIAADGTATVTRRTGETGSCVPDPTALARLRAIDLAAIGTAPPKTPIADGFTYTVEWAGGTASAGDGDTVGPHVELLAAAAAVVSSCVSTVSGSGAPTQ